MKKLLAMLCVVLFVGLMGTAFAEKMEKVDVCHNGDLYTGGLGAPYDDTLWVPGSFVINISGKSVQKHIDNHGDILSFTTEAGDPSAVTRVISDETNTVVGFQTQLKCDPPLE